MKRMLTSKEDHQQCKINGLEYLFAHSSSHVSFNPVKAASSSLLCCQRQHMSSPLLSPSLGFARRPVLASPVAQSWLDPSPHLRFARRPVFASPVTPSSLRPPPRLHFAPSSPRLCGSGSAVLPNGLYAMGGTVAQAVWLKVDRRGNAPLGNSPLSMWWWLPGVCIPITASTIMSARTCLRTSPPLSNLVGERTLDIRNMNPMLFH
ncbi:hypothetical protein OUZ56_027774 [Daphnia magna]|uniref:Uncharacterized protein n=1 Tax=Daphnia magna TaxID=35525 RepID=A0ABR0B1W8_9CRUS|nr:hypothetical protein OUZ56_027774 [Daphnia magna]